MGHELSFHEGRAEMAYYGDTPWHGLGTALPSRVTPDEILKYAHLDWEVNREAVFLDDGSPVPDVVALVRGDHRTVLGVVSSRYRVIQNRQAAELVEAVIGEGAAVAEVAGALKGGRICWMLLRLPDGSFEVVPGDSVQPFVLAVWGHDGKHGVALSPTPVRVVCSNTLTAAGFGGGARWSRAAAVYIRHSGDVSVRIDEARKALGLVRRAFETSAAAYQTLAGAPMPTSAARQYFEQLFPRPTVPARPDDDYLDRLSRWQAHQAHLLQLYESGAGSALPGVRGTAWGAYNAVTEWVDHHYPTLRSGKVSRVRQQAALFGAMADLKQRALALAMPVR